MSEALQNDYRMTLDAFQVLTQDRPHCEKWELIDGEATIQASPQTRHQQIVTNLLFELERIRRQSEADWIVILGIGTRVAGDEYNEIIPDVMILPSGGEDLFNWTYDVLVAFEVLSPGSVRRDMVRKPAIYRRMPALTQYFVVAQDRREVTVFARAQEFKRRNLSGANLLVEKLGIEVLIDDLYRDIRFG